MLSIFHFARKFQIEQHVQAQQSLFLPALFRCGSNPYSRFFKFSWRLCNAPPSVKISYRQMEEHLTEAFLETSFWTVSSLPRFPYILRELGPAWLFFWFADLRKAKSNEIQNRDLIQISLLSLRSSKLIYSARLTASRWYSPAVLSTSNPCTLSLTPTFVTVLVTGIVQLCSTMICKMSW